MTLSRPANDHLPLQYVEGVSVSASQSMSPPENPYIGFWLKEEIGMAAPSREEIDAKLEAAEARTEARIAALEGKFDLVGQKIESLVGYVHHLNVNVDERMQSLRGGMSDLKNEMKEVRQDNRSTRRTIILTVIGAVIAALAALWATQDNLLSAIQLGQTMHTAPSATKAPSPSPDGKPH